MTARKPTPNVLDDLLGGRPAALQPQAADGGLPVHLVPLGRLVDNTWQPRQHNDPDHVLGIARSLLELARTLPATRGLQQLPIARVMKWADSSPISAAAYADPAELRRLVTDPEYVVELAFGHSRRLAFEVLHHGPAGVFPAQYGAGVEQLANLPAHDPAAYAAMPVILLPLTDLQMWQQAVTENAQRRDISAIEEARTLRQAIDQLHLTIEEAGRTLGKSRSAASNLLRLLDLPEEYQQAIVDGTLSETHGRALLTLKPAPHLLKTPIADLGKMPRRELEEHIAGIIAQCRPIVLQRGTGYRSSNGYHSGVRQFDPPAWPLDWQPPSAGSAGSPIVGLCDGCQWRQVFAGDPGPRCTHRTQFAGALTCYDAKCNAWRDHQIALQAAALEERQTSIAPAHTSTAPADTSNTGADVSQETPVSQTPSAAPIYTPTEPGQQVPTWFTQRGGYGDAPGALIDKGLCGPEKCKCFVVAYNEHANGDNLRPDAATAPNMCYGCTSAQRLVRRQQELQHGDMTARRAAIKAENSACEEKLRQAFYRLIAADLWHNSAWMRDLLKAGSLSNGLGQRSNRIDKMEAIEIQEIIWTHVARNNCTVWTQFTVDGETQHWKMERVDAWLARLAAGLSRPIGGVWADLVAPAPAPAVEEFALQLQEDL